MKKNWKKLMKFGEKFNFQPFHKFGKVHQFEKSECIWKNRKRKNKKEKEKEKGKQIQKPESSF